MPNTYTEIHIHLVFAVKYRAALIDRSWKERLHQYTTGIIQRNQHKVLQINSMPDHMHILIGLRPEQSLSELVQKVKTETSKWIKENKFCQAPFYWQVGFGAFSYSKEDLSGVAEYIQHQEEHHRKKTFLDEYRGLLQEFEIPHDERYIFREPE